VELPADGHLLGGRRHLIQHIGQERRRLDKLKGKKIALVYHDSPFGKEPIPLLQERAHARLQLQLLPVTAPGRGAEGHLAASSPEPPDYVLLWGWGVMNSTALKEAQATGYPREKMYGVWWAGAEPDVKDVGAGAKGYNAWRCSMAPTAVPPSSRTSCPRCTTRARAPAPRMKWARCCTCAA
jgi:branched-chain amino acid transport system substrate-binding protein